MRAPVLNCTLKSFPETSSTEALARAPMRGPELAGVETGPFPGQESSG
jgi:hypothetical protein